MNHVWDDIMLKIHNNNDTWEIIEELIPGRRKDTKKITMLLGKYTNDALDAPEELRCK